MNIRSALHSALLTALVITPLQSFAATPPQGSQLPVGVERVTSVEGITEYRLANGLRVLLFPDQTKQTITVNVTYLVGSRHEDYGETGMAHLLEHMVFKGTPKHTNIPQELTAHGARPNGIHELRPHELLRDVLCDRREPRAGRSTSKSDRMVNSFIAKKDLDSEMTVVRNEYESGENSPFRVLLERVASTAFLWHNYGKSTIGARSDIENVPIERLQAFYKKYYQPDNAVLVVAGKFDAAKTLGLIARKFGAIPKPDRVLPTIYTTEPVQDGERSVTVRRTGDTQIVMANYHVSAGPASDFPAVDVLAEIVGDNSPSGRLHKALVESSKATSVFGFTFQQHDPGMLLFGAQLRAEQSLDAARDALLDTVESFATTAPTDEEVNRAKTSLLKQIDLTLNDANRVGLTLSESIAEGDWRLFFLYRDEIKGVTPADVQRAAATYLKPSNRTLGLFIPTAKPDRSEIPPVPDVAALVKDYKGGEAVEEGEAFDASPENILARGTTVDLPGGLKLTFLPKKTRGGAVFANLSLHFGDAKSLMNRSTAGDLAGSMLMRGTTKHSRQQIADEFDRLKARAFVFGGTTQAGASIETTRQNLPDVLRLVAEVLRSPAFPEAEFAQLKQEELTGIEANKTEPRFVASVALSRHLNHYPKGDVRYVETPEETTELIQGTSLDDVKKFYGDFYGASNGELSVVGDFDPKEIQALVTSLFGDWKSPASFTRIPTEYADVAPLNTSIETPDKANAVFLAAQTMPLRDDDPDYPALVLGNYMLGGGFLNSRLATRIRQKEGLSYGVGSGLSASSLDKFGQFSAQAIYAPQNVERLEAAFREEIDRALKDGFTPEEVAAAKSGYLQSRQLSRSQDSGLAGRLSSYRFIGRTMQWESDFEKKVAALTPEEIVAAMRRHMDPSKIVIVKAGDFSGAKKAK